MIQVVFLVPVTVEGASTHDLWLLGCQQCAGDQRCERAAGTSGLVLLSGPTAKVSAVMGHQPAAALHTSHPAASRDPGGSDHPRYTGSCFSLGAFTLH